MNNVLRMGKKVFTVSVVVTTIAWSIGLAALLVPLAAGAASLSAGDLIKASQPAVYYYGADGKRYVFPNEKTYKTWYSDFSSVKKITDAELAAISIGGNVTYKPGVKMVKITTDPKVYAVDAGGTLRWINSETMAANLYGTTWAKSIEDVPDAFFVNYKTGSDIALTTDFVKATVTAAAVSINVDKGLASGGTGGTGALSIALADGNPVSSSAVVDATDGGARRFPMLKVKLTAGAADVKVTGLNFKRGGISKDADLDNMLLMDGSKVIVESQSITTAGVKFALAAGDLTVSANTSKVIDVVANLNKLMATGSTLSFSLASADVTSDAATVSGSAVGNTMTNVIVTDLGSLGVSHVSYPASVDPGTLAKEMWRVTFAAQSQDLLLTYVRFNNLGSSYDSDVQNIKLMDAATQLNGVVAQIKDKVVEFDLTNMTGGGYKILAGTSKQLTLVGDIVSGTSRTFRWSIQKDYDVRATDLQYNTGAYVYNVTAATFAVISASAVTNINTGSLNMSVSASSPSSNVPASGTNITLAKFNFKATGEDVKVTDLTVLCTGSTTTRYLKNTKILLDGIQVGTTDTQALCDGSTDETAYSFGNSFIIGADKTAVVSIVADLTGTVGNSVGGLTSTAWAAEDTVYVGFGGTVASMAQGKTSLTAINVTAVNGRTLTLKTGTVAVLKNSSFTDRSATFPTGVANATGVKVASFVIIGGSGEPVDVSQIVLADGASYFMGNNFQNLMLKDGDGKQVGATISTLNASHLTYTFTPSVAIRIAEGQQKTFDVYADVKGSVSNAGSALAMIQLESVAATGVNTSASANLTSDIALQSVYLALHGKLTIDESSDTPIAQQLVLGSTGAELAKFKLSANAVEDINITQFIVADDMSTAYGGAGNEMATGSIKNFKLYNGSTLLASVSSLDSTYNTHTPYATFTGFSLTVPKNQNLTLTVKADLASYDDGGRPSSTHRIIVPVSYKDVYDLLDVTAGNESPYVLAVTAVGAGSGMAMSYSGLDLLGSTTTAGAKRDVQGSYMDLVRAKLSLAHAADAPSGAAAAGTEQTVAKFVATNSANAGNYSLTLNRMNLTVSSSGNSMTDANTLNIYKDSISTANLLVTTEYDEGLVSGLTTGYYSDTQLGNLTSTLEIAAGSSKTIVVTLETSFGGFGSADTLSIGVASNDVLWVDGGTTGGGNAATYYTCNSLPIAGKTLVY